MPSTASINFIGGEKGGVGKSVVARLLAQYFIDHECPFVGFDTDRSHTSFTRFYADYASPVVVDSYEGLDHIAAVFEENTETSVIVDLAAQTAAPLAHWMQDSDVVALMHSIGVRVNLWHVADAGQDSVVLLENLLATYGDAPNYIVVKNHGRGSDFSQLEASSAYQKVQELGGNTIINLAQLHEASMRKIDKANASFWAAINTTKGDNALGMLERQRVKMWLKGAYAEMDALGLTSS
ncbi:MAG: hypothetical protein RLZZ495_728 [Pseudomonadota bacterium]